MGQISLSSLGGILESALFAAAVKVFVIAVGGILAVRLLGAVTNKVLAAAKVNAALCQVIQTSVRCLGYLALIVAVLGAALDAFGINSVTWFESTGLLAVRALIIFVLGVALIGALDQTLRKALPKSKIDVTLHAFITSAVKAILLVVLIISCVGALGVDTTSLIATLSAAALALALSVKDNLSNLIGGAVVLFTKPFSVGDFIEIDGHSGSVEEIGLFYTTLKTADRKTIFIPNNDTAKAKIINHSASPVRRLDMTFQIGYQDDFEKAKQIIRSAAEQSEMMLSSPSPVIRVSAHGADAVEIVARLWVNWPDYFELQFYMLEEVKRRFDQEGITIPYRQMDIHLEQ